MSAFHHSVPAAMKSICTRHTFLFLLLTTGMDVQSDASLASTYDNSTCSFLHRLCLYTPGVLRSIKTDDPAVCCKACDANSACVSWTLNTASGTPTCYLKSYLPIENKSSTTCTSGVRPGAVPSPPIPPSPPPVPPLPPFPPAPPNALNVLFIAVDDLRPEIGAYGYNHAPPTPNLDKFAKTALKFDRAYVQYSFCCPSRNSFMSGRRPSKTKVWNFKDHFREIGIGADWISLPGWFKDHGYFVHGMGKLYHPGLPPNDDGNMSWTEPSRYSQQGQIPYLPNSTYVGSSVPPFQVEECITGERGGSYCEMNQTQGPDDQLMDVAVTTLGLLANYTKATGRPFFLGVGFHKPHIPWTIPTRFFQRLPSIDDTDLPLHPAVPEGMPPVAWNKGLGQNALDSYKDANACPLHPNVSFPDPLTRAMRRGYRAAVTYMDWMTGNVLDALDETGLQDQTVVLFIGDHGYQLGEHNLWCKMTVFELGTRVPFFIRAPDMQAAGETTQALVEAVDIYPTLIDLAAGVGSTPEYLDGKSLRPLLANSSATVKLAVFSEFVKCYSCCRVPDNHPCETGGPAGRCVTPGVTNLSDLSEMSTCFAVPREQFDFVGYSVRTNEWRYTEWLHWNGTLLHGDFHRKVAAELYDHTHDDGTDPDVSENKNLIGTAPAATVQTLHDVLVQGFPLVRLDI
eukprot:m.531580 g.531580  ORF g.531580 m.531580 type:complete len:682 (-) comp22038_c0_seq1:179-2224(-)